MHLDSTVSGPWFVQSCSLGNSPNGKPWKALSHRVFAVSETRDSLAQVVKRESVSRKLENRACGFDRTPRLGPAPAQPAQRPAPGACGMRADRLPGLPGSLQRITKYCRARIQGMACMAVGS